MNRISLPVLLALAAPSSAFASTWTVCGSSSCDYASIGAALASGSVVNGDTLDLASETYTENGITVTKNVAIVGDGPGNTIIASSALTADTIDFSNATASLSGVSISIANGRGIDISGGSVTLSNISIPAKSNILGSINGLGVRIANADALIEDSTFTNLDSNTPITTQLGGAIYVDQSAASSAKVVTLDNVTVTQSSADIGGGVYAIGAYGTLAITGGSYTNNTAAADGGAIAADEAAVTIYGSALSLNLANRGGGVFVNEGSLSVYDVGFERNTATTQGGAVWVAATGAISTSDILSNQADVGAGVYVEASYMLLDNVAFGAEGGGAGNTATTIGGGLYATSGSTIDSSGSGFYDNTAKDGAGLVLVDSGASIVGGSFQRNIADDTTGTVTGGALSISTTGVTARNVSLDGVSFNSNQADGVGTGSPSTQGGAIWVSADSGAITLTLGFDSGLDFVSNSARANGSNSGRGGAVYLGGTGSLTVGGFDARFTSNSANSDGGAISVGGSNVVLSLYGGAFTSNSAPAGGAISFRGDGSLALLGAQFASNVASTGGGGALIMNPATSSGADLTITGGRFASNTSTTTGGAVALFSMDDVTITDAVFQSNTAASGAAIGATSADFVNAYRNRFCANEASSAGGAVYLDATSPNALLNNVFADNGAGSGGGGAVRLTSSATSSVLANNVFVDDNATGTNSGGAVSAAPAITFDNNVIAHSRTDNGVEATGTITSLQNNAAYDNLTNSFRVTSVVSAGTGTLTLDPAIALFDYTSPGNCTTSDYRAFYDVPGSVELRNGAVNSVGYNDLDSTRGDIGLYGGPQALATAWSTDDDGDGWFWVYDCDDDAPDVHPTATELACDGIDQNCDGLDDSTGTATLYRDADLDGYGDPLVTTTSTCIAGYVTNSLDCNDANAAISPADPEICDAGNVDEDCDGLADDNDEQGGTGGTAGYADNDSDGFGGVALTACDPVPVTPGDCDDFDGTVNPAADEVCNGVDDDCDSLVDDADAGEPAIPTWYTDDDGDTFGDPSAPIHTCTQPSNSSIDNTDCDDSDPSVNPNGQEVCDAADLDEDCDGLVDDGDDTTKGFVPWYDDLDDDDYGNASDSTPRSACNGADGESTDHTDCNDSSALYHPGAPEVCPDPDYNCDGVDGSVDGDGDGDPVCSDCDDTDPGAHAGATEICNGADDDCDGVTDENAPTWYADADHDGYGDLAASQIACAQPTNHVSNSTDCDDSDPDVHPTAPEHCDGVDEDCDSAIDDSPIDPSTWYVDADGDSYGTATSILACSQPSGYGPNPGDCNDSSASVHPNATEQCNAIDDDCDGSVDENVNDVTWYRDADADGYGVDSNPVVSCAQPSGYSAAGGDCQDANPAIHPGAVETCDSVDQDCDGVADDNATDATPWYADADADLYGDDSSVLVRCTRPAGHVATDGDCDDGDFQVNPGADEVCDGVDNDCDATVDEPDAIDALPWYRDGDHDGLGEPGSDQIACDPPSGYVDNDLDCDDTDPTVTNSTFYGDVDGDGYGDDGDVLVGCLAPSGYVSVGGDCNDGDDAIHPGATETCDAADQDCDGVVDDSPSDGTSFYPDGDNDGFGDASQRGVVACTAPSGTVADNGDCDDTNAQIRPNAPEQCDGIDNDCSGVADDNVVYVDWYADDDGDAFGDPLSTPVNACIAPTGTIDNTGDCDDTDAAVNPLADEVCDSVDNDCDTQIDEAGALDEPAWWRDADNDGYGLDGTEVYACSAPGGYVDNALDCDDSDPTVDQYEFYGDADGDGHGEPLDTAYGCVAPSGYVDVDDDCDDLDAGVFPGADERCDGVDEDCDGAVDDAPVDGLLWYVDGDNDGFGDAGSGVAYCTPPSGMVSDGTDCDDGDPRTRPGAPEQCDGLDNDCDAIVDEDVVSVDWWPDSDQDGFGDTGATPVTACLAPADSVDNGLDCDDLNIDISPVQLEVCDAVDQDCDGEIDEDPQDASLWFYDGDGDGDGDPSLGVSACEAPVDYVAGDGDCDDADPARHSAAIEVCNEIDDDCDGAVDDDATGTIWYTDDDGDGFGDDSTAVDTCTPSDEQVLVGGDCDDSDADANPDAVEVYYNGADDDCDASTADDDQDADGFGAEDLGGDDCDDLDADINPDAEEIPGDTVDQDCDGSDQTANGHDREHVDDTGVLGSPKGCDCDSGGTPSLGWLVVLIGAGMLRRRR